MYVDFVKLGFDTETRDRLFEFCLKNRLGIANVDDQSVLKPGDFKFHVTVMYSRVTNEAFQEGEFDISEVLRPSEYALFGPDENLLVLRLHKDDYLRDLHDHYRETYGHVSDFDPYQPHVTIKGGNSIPRSFPPFNLRVDRLIHRRKEI
jgi:hypothetical protein